jgi:hypothetical protein
MNAIGPLHSSRRILPWFSHDESKIIVPYQSGASKPAFSAMAAFSALFLESTLFWSGLLLAVTIMLCSEARAQARSNGSPTGQKSPERSVPRP